MLLLFAAAAVFLHTDSLRHPYAGIRLAYSLSGWTVTGLDPSGEARDWGIQAGDKLQSLDGKAPQQGTSGAVLTLERMETAVFEKPDGRLLPVAVTVTKKHKAELAFSVLLELLLLGMGGYAYLKKSESYMIRRYFGFTIHLALIILTVFATDLLVSDLILAVCAGWLPYALFSFFVRFAFHTVRPAIRRVLGVMQAAAVGLSLCAGYSILSGRIPDWILGAVHLVMIGALLLILAVSKRYWPVLNRMERNHLLVLLTGMYLSLAPYLFFCALPGVLGIPPFLPPEYALVGLVPLSGMFLLLLVKRKMIDMQFYTLKLLVHTLFLGLAGVLCLLPESTVRPVWKLPALALLTFVYHQGLSAAGRQAFRHKEDWLERQKLRLSIGMAEERSRRDLLRLLAGMVHRIAEVEGVWLEWRRGERAERYGTGIFEEGREPVNGNAASSGTFSLVLPLSGGSGEDAAGTIGIGPKTNGTLFTPPERSLLEKLGIEASRLLANADVLSDLQREYQTLKDRSRVYEKHMDDMNRYHHFLLEAQETERIRTSYYLHDHLLQNLIFLSRDLEELFERRTVDRNQVGLWLKCVYDSQRDIRMLCDELYPHIVDKAGLKESLVWLCRSVRESRNLEVELLDGLSPGTGAGMRPALKTHLFRMIRELVNNAAKHSQGSNVRIELREDGEAVTCTVADNGTGFDVTGLHRDGVTGKQLGLLSVSNQVRFLQGEMKVESAPGQGTVIRLRLPLLQEEVQYGGNVDPGYSVG